MLSAPARKAAAKDSNDPTGAIISKSSLFISFLFRCVGTSHSPLSQENLVSLCIRRMAATSLRGQIIRIPPSSAIT